MLMSNSVLLYSVFSNQIQNFRLLSSKRKISMWNKDLNQLSLPRTLDMVVDLSGTGYTPHTDFSNLYTIKKNQKMILLSYEHL